MLLQVPVRGDRGRPAPAAQGDPGGRAAGRREQGLQDGQVHVNEFEGFTYNNFLFTYHN